MGIEHAGRSGLVPCGYELDPDDQELSDADPQAFETVDVDDYDLTKHLDIDQKLLKPSDNDDTAKRVWQCRRLTEPDADEKPLCPFHRDPADREVSDALLSQLCLDLLRGERAESDLVDEYIETHVSDGVENADEALKIEPWEAEPTHGEAVARRRKMFCGAKFERFDLSQRVFDTPDRYPIDFQGAVIEELDWSNAVVDSPVLANGLRAPTPDAPREFPQEGGNVRFSGAEIRGELSLLGLATEGKVSLSETTLRDVLLDDAVVGNELSVREATIHGKLTATEIQTAGRFLALQTQIDTRLSLSDAQTAKLKMSQSTTGHGLSLHEMHVCGELNVTQSSLGGRCSMHNATVDEEASFHATRVDGDLVFNEATLRGDVALEDTVVNGDVKFKNTTSYGGLTLEDAVIDSKVEFDQTSVGGDLSLENAAVDGRVSIPASLSIVGGLRCEAATIQSLKIDRPEAGGPLDLTRIEVNSLRITPPTMENRHPAIRAVTLRDCRVGTAALAPLAPPADAAETSTSPAEPDTVVYDLEGGSVETLEEPEGSVPRGKSLYDYLRLVETDFTNIDFSVHRDRLFQNEWNLHGLRESGEDDVQLARRFDDIRDFLSGAEQETTDVLPEETELRRLVGLWCDRTDDAPDQGPDGQYLTVPHDIEEPASPADAQDDIEAVIASSRVLSALDTVVSVPDQGRTWLHAQLSKDTVAATADRRPSTITLDQLESTYAGAKTAADAIGENEAASAFFVREQWYIQLQNRRHIREEFPPVYRRAVRAVQQTFQRGRDALSKLSASGSRKTEPDVQTQESESADSTTQTPAAQAEDEAASESADQSHPEDDLKRDGGREASDGTADATETVDLSIPPAKPRKLLRYLLAWLSNAFLRVFTRYGESPRRVLGWWLGIITMWSSLYYLIALARLGWTDPWQLLVEQGLGFLLLSIGSFTTVIPALPVLPFGADAPERYSFLSDDWVITMFSEIEGLLGVLFISLFVLTLTRSIQR